MEQTSVAVVDSHPALSEGLSAMLASDPALRVVAVASSMNRVADLIATRQPDVLVLDADLEDPECAELIRRVGLLQPRTAIVLLTCRDDAETTSAAMRVGASACVLKVAPAQELLAAVHAANRGETWISPVLLDNLLTELRSRSEKVPDASRLTSLTEREVEILELLVEGLGHKEIARRLDLALNTVRTHTRNIQMKLGVHSNLAAVAIALEAGLRPS